MALPETLSLKNATAATVSFTRRTIAGSSAMYENVASTAALVHRVYVQFTVGAAKALKDAWRRPLVKYEIIRIGADGKPHTATLQLSLIRSTDPSITDTDVADLLALHSEFLVTAAGDLKTRWLRGEV